MKFEKSLNQERVYIDMTFLCEEMVLNSPPPSLFKDCFKETVSIYKVACPTHNGIFESFV